MHELGSITTEQVYLELTFLTLAMLVVGGVIEPLGSRARRAHGERGELVPVRGGARVKVGATLDLPSGTRLIILGSIMALVLIVRPSGPPAGGKACTW